jgi:hypothetical protein
MTMTRLGPTEPALDMVNVWGGIWGPHSLPILVNPVSQAIAINTTIYFVLNVPTVCTVRRFWWANGATAAGNIIAALYNDAGFKPGARLGTTAATAQGTINQVQFVAPSGGDFAIPPGTYWLALASSSGSSTFFGGSLAIGPASTMMMQEATATPPATATPVERTSSNAFVCGFSTTTLV